MVVNVMMYGSIKGALVQLSVMESIATTVPVIIYGSSPINLDLSFHLDSVSGFGSVTGKLIQSLVLQLGRHVRRLKVMSVTKMLDRIRVRRRLPKLVPIHHQASRS